MSYEKRIRDLMERLVSMTPEPPPYPEEVTMAQQQTRRRSRPALAFVGAAVLVALLAVPVILLMSGEPGVVAGTTTTTTPPVETTTSLPDTSTTTTPGDVTTTTPGVTESTEPVLGIWSSVVYFYQVPENSFLGNPALVPLWIEVTDPSGVLTPDHEFTDVLAVIGPDLPDAFENAIPGDVRILSLSTHAASTQGEFWIADMNETFLAGAGGLLADFTMLNQLIYTIVGSSTIEEVLFTVNGNPVTEFGSEGLVLTEPVGREDFIDQLAPIFLTEPLLESGAGYSVSGMSNVFEAAVSLAVIDDGGQAIYEDDTTATCGTGCWGGFSFEVPADQVTPGESAISVFTFSAEDGSMIDVITVPIPDGGVWRISVED